MNQLSKPFSLRTRVTLFMLTSVVLTVTVASAVSIYMFRGHVYGGINDTVQTTSASLAQACELPLAIGDDSELQLLVDTLLLNKRISFVAIYDHNRKLVTHSSRDEKLWNEYVAKQEATKNVLLGTSGVYARSADESIMDVFGTIDPETGLPLDPEDAPHTAPTVHPQPTDPTTGVPAAAAQGNDEPKAIGSVVVAVSTTPFEALLTHHMFSTIGFVCVAMLTTLAFAFFQVTRWTNRLNNVVRAAEQLRAGKLEGIRYEDEYSDEIGVLVTAFKGMSSAVHDRDRELREFNDNLQELVSVRTAELKKLALVASRTDNAVAILDPQGRVEWVNDSFARITGYSSSEIIGFSPLQLLTGDDTDMNTIADMKSSMERHQPIEAELVITTKDGDSKWVEIERRPIFDDESGKLLHFISVARDISPRKAADAEKEELNRQLIEASRHAGMAEIATSVLHNVGNVLNSINVAAGVIQERLRQSRVPNLAKAATLIEEHRDDLFRFLNEDERGQHLPVYLIKLSEHLTEVHQSLLNELTGLMHNVEHIKEIVSVQQSYAKLSGIVERVDLRELLADAVRMNLSGLDRHHIEIVREFEPTPRVYIDKHKVLQILVNLISNAKYALIASNASHKQLTIQIGFADENKTVAKISVSDNGVGIKKDNLKRIFSHGFTTRRGGHGFGLHGAAISTKEMGGSLSATSDGPGMGATFTLELPIKTSRSDAGQTSQTQEEALV